MLINGREKVGIKILKGPKTFIDYSQRTEDVYKYLQGYNPTRKRRVLLEFDGMITDMELIKN